MYKNFEGELLLALREKAKKNITKIPIPGEDYIPVTGKLIDIDDLLSSVDASLDGWLTTGRFANQFEKELAKYFGSRFALFVNSGSSANLIAFSS